MDATFNSVEFLKDLSQELINGFRKAGKGTTPVIVGSAREQEVRNKLELIFPQSIGIGTGCVIDANKKTSKQTDIVIYEKEICPVFSINNTSESTYYPCEGVIAVGEIKSTLNTKELIDSFEKIKSVKNLKRMINNPTCYRNYCSRLIIQGADSDSYSQEAKSFDQIYGFILCEKIGLKLETFLERCAELIRGEESHLLPNIIVSLHDGVFIYLDTQNKIIREDKLGANCFYNTILPDGEFQFLLNKLNTYINLGRTTDVIPFEKYVIGNTNVQSGGKLIQL